jgi:alginate O-acetyltransferase complex protein AlgI
MNFLIWGALHGLILTIERSGFARILQRLWKPIQHVYLIFVILITWVFFRAETLTEAVAYLKTMFAFRFHSAPFELIEAINTEVWLAGLFGIVLTVPWYGKRIFTTPELSLAEKGGMRELKAITAARILLVMSLLTLASIQLASSTHNPFIYFRF